VKHRNWPEFGGGKCWWKKWRKENPRRREM